jgi:hypothetical protein
MIAKTYILANLKALDYSYRHARTAKEAQFFAKLAILELCGWIEESMDDIVLRCGRKHLKQTSNQNYCAKQVVQRTFGFDYHKNFRFMLIRVLGLIVVERVENEINAAIHQRLVSALSTLKQQRDREAHTHLKGMARTINAPSVTITQFQPVYDGLRDFDKAIRARKKW